jgi:hypothetical protein
MAGIKANSTSQTMGNDDTAVDKTVSGYVRAEAIVLTTYPTGTTYSWGQTKPAGAGVSSELTSATDAGPQFTPDAAGTWLVTCTVDGTSYQIRIGVSALTFAESVQAIRLTPINDSEVPTPTGGTVILYNSVEQGGLTKKDDAGDLYTIDETAV